MNKRQKEVLQVALKDEETVIKELERNYTAALADIKRNIRELQANPLTQSKAYQLEFQKQLETQISGILDALQGRNFSSVADYLQRSYTTGFVGNMYDMQGQGVPLVIPIDENQVLKAVQKTGDDFKLSNKKGISTKELKKQVQSELIRGLATQLTYTDIARNISEYGLADMHRAATIARTEGHRVQNQARFDSMQAAKKKGADIVKQWDSTLDGKTRPEHAHLDGQIRELDENFESDGYSAPAPGAFGDPYMDCNCRCCMLQRARWAVKNESTYTKWNNETGGFIECSGYEDFKEKYLKSSEKLKKPKESGIIKDKPKDTIQILDRLKNSGMSESDYDEYLKMINEGNPDITRLYKGHADEISKVTYSFGRGAYQPSTNSLTFDYPQYSDMNKYGTLAHEYGHFFDAKVQYDGLHFTEIKAVQNATGLNAIFSEVASSSDEFLAAIRKDKAHIRSILTETAKTDLANHNASHGVQDAIDGLFPKSRIRWGHGERYYNRKYADIEFMDKMSTTSRKKALQQAYKDLGLDASNQAKTKVICRQYEAASEAWANIISAEVCGGESLEYVKKYLPNSYQAMLEILKGVK